MPEPSRLFKISSVTWSVLIAIGVIVLGIAVILPSTPDHEPEALGVDEPMPTSYMGQLLHPFRLRGLKSRFFA